MKYVTDVHTWNKLGHLAINSQSHDSANGPFLTIMEGKGKGEGVQDSAIMARQKMIYSMYADFTLL